VVVVPVEVEPLVERIASGRTPAVTLAASKPAAAQATARSPASPRRLTLEV
jgi:hypothetical protein